jgi:anti-sigma B factor antagonist
VREMLQITMQLEDGAAVVRTTGELDASTAPQLRDCFEELIRSDCRNVVVNMGELDFIDSTGLGVLVAGLKRFRGAGGSLSVTDPRAQIRKVLELTSLDRELLTDAGR